MWYLIVWITGAYAPSIAIIPEKYPTEEACHAAAKSDRWSHSCIPAPKAVLMCNQVVGATAIPVPCDPPTSGYYCGQHPEKCSIFNDTDKNIFCTQTGNNSIICR